MRYVCIHGHFYQPPRENPWTDQVPRQPSAAPYHDWNERITAECYRPNGLPRDNYRRISFNFGPTLQHWFSREDPQMLDLLLQADRTARMNFSGHGPALAQAWGHAILPLCNARDRRTQVAWGLKDFSFRFGRQAEGFWLPETAVDTATLETLSLFGVSFTILSPFQAAAVRSGVDGRWHELPAGDIDTTRAYRVVLPSGRTMALFFYDGSLSAAIAFEGLLDDGHALAQRMIDRLVSSDEPQLVHTATDGETYGHHHKDGVEALTVALDRLEAEPNLRLTCYAEFLERHPPRDEVRIVENSAWSCAHGLGRWQRHCGCASSDSSEQKWRAPLRRGIADLRDRIAAAWERRTAELLHDPWSARDDWIERFLDPSAEREALLLKRHARRVLNESERRELDLLFELQRNLIQTETSCAWFFEDLARIETVQVLQYAARAIELAKITLGVDALEPLLAHLEKARSNDPTIGNGRELWRLQVATARPHCATDS